MFYRQLSQEILDLAKSYPILTVTGPRQSGKTTLVRHLFPEKPYVSLEPLDTRALAEEDPRQFLEQFSLKGAILDEIQRCPSLLPYIQTIVDEKPDLKGLFVLTGSHQIELHESIVQSLAGRTALLKLLPMSIFELEEAGIHLSLDELILSGGYPRIYKDQLDPTKAYRNYFQTYVERDVRQMVNIRNLGEFQRFVHLCVGRIGQLLNFESLANGLGISSRTVKEWISILEASFIVMRLQPYYENFGKRVIKAPKLYFTDVGLATYLLGIETIDQLARDPLRGSLVENLIILEIMKARLNRGLDPQLYYFRDAQGHEVDLLYQSANQLVPIEIKSAQTYHRDFLKNIHFFHQLVGARAPRSFVVYSGIQEQTIGSTNLLNYKRASQIPKMI